MNDRIRPARVISNPTHKCGRQLFDGAHSCTFMQKQSTYFISFTDSQQHFCSEWWIVQSFFLSIFFFNSRHSYSCLSSKKKYIHCTYVRILTQPILYSVHCTDVLVQCTSTWHKTYNNQNKNNNKQCDIKKKKTKRQKHAHHTVLMT